MLVHPDLAAAAAAWDALPPPTPFHTRAWLEAWMRHVGARDGLEARVLEVRSPGGAPWLVWPLGLHRAGPLVELRVLSGILTDYQGPLIAPGCPEDLLTRDFPSLWARALEQLDRVDLLHLERLPATLGGRPNPAASLGASRFPADSHALTLDRDWDSLYADRCSKRTRQKDRHKLRRLEDLGPVRFEVADTPAARLDLLPVALALKSDGYAALGVPDLFADVGRRAFLEELAARPDSPLHLTALHVGDRVAATHLGVRDRTTLYFLFPGYDRDPALAPYSPGAELVRRNHRLACERGLQRVDFTLGDEAYKDRWCDRAEAQYVVDHALTTRGQAVVQARRISLAARARVKASPQLADAARTARALLGRVRPR